MYRNEHPPLNQRHYLPNFIDGSQVQERYRLNFLNFEREGPADPQIEQKSGQIRYLVRNQYENL